MPDGFNPMRWDCGRDGCFNKKRRPKIEVFAECFPRRINFGDVDGLVELSGFFCLLEWKGQGGSIRRGQQLSYIQFTQARGNIVFVVEGDPESMEVSRYCIFWAGSQHDWQRADLTTLKDRIRKWVVWAQAQARAA